MREINHLAHLPDETLAKIAFIPEKHPYESIWVDIKRGEVHIRGAEAKIKIAGRLLPPALTCTVYSLHDLRIIREY